MQHVADEAGMSAGQSIPLFPLQGGAGRGPLLYATRPSAPTSSPSMTLGGDIPAAIAATLREHLLSRPPEKARMIIEIWTEAARNPRIAEITRALDDDVRSGLERILDAAKAAGSVAPSVDSRFAASVIFTLVARPLQTHGAGARLRRRGRGRDGDRRNQGVVCGRYRSGERFVRQGDLNMRSLLAVLAFAVIAAAGLWIGQDLRALLAADHGADEIRAEDGRGLSRARPSQKSRPRTRSSLRR